MRAASEGRGPSSGIAFSRFQTSAISLPLSARSLALLNLDSAAVDATGFDSIPNEMNSDGVVGSSSTFIASSYAARIDDLNLPAVRPFPASTIARSNVVTCFAVMDFAGLSAHSLGLTYSLKSDATSSADAFFKALRCLT